MNRHYKILMSAVYKHKSYYTRFENLLSLAVKLAYKNDEYSTYCMQQTVMKM